jgi:DNA-binding response OmpR family regulator
VSSAAAPRVLMVEDDPDFAVLTRRAFAKAEVSATLDVIGDGEAAIGYVEGVLGSPPALVLLDLKLPKVSGFEVLRWIRGQDSLSTLPVIVLTSSGQDRDRAEARELGASDFRVKPAGFPELVDLVREVSGRWLGRSIP